MGIETVAMLLAGGQGTRLYDLTHDIAKPAVEFGGRYRIIDFPLTNCTHSSIDVVGILTQYQPLLLNDYVNSGLTWDLDREYGGLHILPPYTTSKENLWFEGTAHAIWANYNFIEMYDPEYVLILSGDHIYNMDYSQMIENHKNSNNDLTICVKQVPMEEAYRFGIMETDDDNNIIAFEEKPKNPKNDLASMGIYVFNKEVLKKYLQLEEQIKDTEFDFGKNIIPRILNDHRKIGAYVFDGYWMDVGTIGSLWQANMDLLNPELEIINNHNWPLYSKKPSLHPAIYNKAIVNDTSLIMSGCVLSGIIEHSIIGYGCSINSNSYINNSVLHSNVIIESNVILNYCLVKSNTIIPKGTIIEGTIDNIILVTNNYINNLGGNNE